MKVNYQCVAFDQLTTKQLYELLKLRVDVFVVEQDCPYPDLDDKDQAAYHLLAYDEQNRLAAYTRLLAPGVSYVGYSAIGRVVTASFARGQGLGRPLMLASIEWTKKHYGQAPIKISAQAHLQAYYQSVGFRSVGDEYLEDGIPHIAMVLANVV